MNKVAQNCANITGEYDIKHKSNKKNTSSTITQQKCADRSVRLTVLLKAANDETKGKGKVFIYSLPSVGPGADPGVQAVSPQVT